MNRKITEEFEGDLTDVKVNQIIENMVCLQNLRKICQGGEMETF